MIPFLRKGWPLYVVARIYPIRIPGKLAAHGVTLGPQRPEGDPSFPEVPPSPTFPQENDVKTTASKRRVSAKGAPSVIQEEERTPDTGRRLEHIATAAYYKAESRGFVPGLEMDDWLEAEAEYDEEAGGES